MRYPVFVFFLFVSCSKEPVKQSFNCEPDGMGCFEIYNGFHVPLEVRLHFTAAVGALDSTQYAHRFLQEGETWEQQMQVGEWYVRATGEEPPPYAHNSFVFEKTITLDDCEVMEIQY